MNYYNEPESNYNEPKSNYNEFEPKNRTRITAVEFLRSYGHWLELSAIVLMYVLIGLMRIEDGSVTLTNFRGFTWLDWVLWGISTFLPGMVSLFIYDALRKEGIKQAKKLYPELIQEYYNLIKQGSTGSLKVRSEREYLREKAGRNAVKNFTLALIVSFITGSLLISATTESLVKIGINLGMWAYIGIKSLNESRDYGETELREWYMKEVHRMMVESRRYIGG